MLAALLAGFALSAALLLTGLLPALLRVALLRVALLLLVTPRVILLLVRLEDSPRFRGVTATLRPRPGTVTREPGPGSASGAASVRNGLKSLEKPTQRGNAALPLE
jgi:hypothetical protein